MPSICIQKIKKKIRISLIIRLSVLLCLTLIFFITSLFLSLGNSELSSETVTNHNRKLLSVIDKPSSSSPLNDTDLILKSQGYNKMLKVWKKFYNLIDSSNHSQSDKSEQLECTKPTILKFPSDGLTRDQRQMGWIVVHLILVCYCFWLLAIVCEGYLVPVIDTVCKRFRIQEDVAAATFMAAAVSSPELFINIIGTFVTKGDLGIGTIVGSAVFNTLAVPACCSLITRQVVDLDWWPISRDSLMYSLSILILISALYDGKIFWYESLIMLIAYALYITFMYYNRAISKRVKSFVDGFKQLNNSRCYNDSNESTPLLVRGENNCQPKFDLNNNTVAKSPWTRGESNACIYFMSWPATILLWLTIPDCRKNPKFLFFTFIMCMMWIGATSYVSAFFITIIGDTVNIPDSVMGLTFLGIGTSIPETVASVIVTSQGHGGMGLSNSLGSNTFDILFCLGLPWFIKAVFLPAVPGNPWVSIYSGGLPYNVLYLLSSLFGLYIAFFLNKFQLNLKIGVTCTLMYITFLIFSSLVELNVFFKVNLPTCSH